MAKSVVLVRNDVIYRRFPESKTRAHRYYFQAEPRFIRAGFERTLHRQIWRDANGAIPPGFHIHHVDGNPHNNDLSNLTCVEAGEHVRSHSGWHSTEDGRAYHSAVAYAYWDNPQKKTLVCAYCGGAFVTTSSKQSTRFCSDICRCRQRNRTLETSPRTCAFCGGEFYATVSSRIKCCSRSCGQRNRMRHFLGDG